MKTIPLRASSSPPARLPACAGHHWARRLLVSTLAGTVLLTVPSVSAAQQPGAPAAGDATSAEQPAVDPSTLSLEELLGIEVESVFGASKALQKITEAPASVTIVSADDIARFGWRTMADVLRNVRGFYTTSDRNYGYLGARGFQPPGDYNARILVTVDGLRQNDNVFDGALFDENFQLDLDEVDRIEIIRGPSSSLYGSSAFFAVINVVTLSPARAANSVVVTGSAGSLGHRDARVRLRRHFKGGAALSLLGNVADSNGDASLYTPEYDTPETNSGISNGLDYMERRNVFGRLDFKGLLITGLYNSWVHGNPNGAYGSIYNRPASNREEHTMLFAAWERALGRGWTGVFRGGYDRYGYTGTYTFPGEDGTSEQTYLDNSRGQFWTGEAQFSRSFAGHQLTTGAEHRRNPQQDQYSFLGGSDTPYWSDRRSSSTTGLYVQDQWRLSSKVLVNGGLRLDHYPSFKDPLKPRVALILQPTATTTVKGIYGSAFRAPAAYERYYEIPGAWKARPDLRPEQVQTLEGIVEHYAGRRLRLSAGVYRLDVSDLIALVSDPDDESLVFYDNVEGVDASGVELEAEARWPSGVHGRVSYTYARTHSHGSREQLVNSPRHVGQALVSVPLGREFFFSVDLQALSRRFTIRREVLNGRVSPNLAVTGRVSDRGRLLFTIKNVTNARYFDPVGEDFTQDAAQQYGRVARLQFSWTF